MLKAVIWDLGNTLIHEVEDSIAPLDHYPILPQAGAAMALAWCRDQGWRMGVLSNTVQSDDAVIRRVLQRFGWDGWFAAVRGTCSEGSTRPGKPDPEVFDAICAALHCIPAEAVMIGDTWATDIVGAIGIGMHAIWIHDAPADELPLNRPRPGLFVSRVPHITAVVPALQQLAFALSCLPHAMTSVYRPI